MDTLDTPQQKFFFPLTYQPCNRRWQFSEFNRMIHSGLFLGAWVVDLAKRYSAPPYQP